MNKGYWIVRVDVTRPEQFSAYAAAIIEVWRQYGARILARGGRFECVEGRSRARNTVIEFASFQQALDCWHSAEYQAVRRLRAGAAELDAVVVEGV